METPIKGFVIEYEFSIGDILSRSFSILFQNPVVYFGLALATTLPALLIDSASISSDLIGGTSTFLDFVLGLIIQGGIAYAVYQGLQGRKVSIGDAVSNGLSRIGTLIPLAVLTVVCCLVGLLALIIPGIILLCMWTVVVQCCVIEGLGVMESLQRSAELTKGYRLHIFGLMILLIVIALGLLFMVMFLLGGLLIVNPVIGTLLATFFTVSAVAFNCVMTAIIYADLRAVKEGATIDSLVNVFD